MGYTLIQLKTKLGELQSKAMDKAVELLNVIENLPNMLLQDLDKKNFNMILTGYAQGQLIQLLQKNNFKTNGLVGTYVNNIQYSIDISSEMEWSINYTDESFDRNHMVKTEYTTANGKHVIHKISSGNIIDMIDSGRDNFDIKPKNSVVVKFGNQKYRYLVYRAKSRNKRDNGYYKYKNYDDYDPGEKDQRIMLVPDKTSINVNGSKYSNFGLGIYEKIEKYANSSEIHIKILGKSIDDYIVDFIHIHTSDLFNELTNIIFAFVKYRKMYKVERARQ